MELGDADDAVFKTVNSKQKGGTIGKVTHGLLDRTHYYEHALLCALAPFLHDASGLYESRPLQPPTKKLKGVGAPFIDKLALIVVENRKQLVARSRGKRAFFTPGGKRKPGESDEDALVRECKEELTIDLQRETIVPFGVFEAQAHGKPAGTVVRMTCYTARWAGSICANEEIEELRWITSDCPHEDLSDTGLLILNDLKAKDLID